MVLQVMDDRWESEIIEFGAINITGFRIVDTNRRLVREFYDSWKRSCCNEYVSSSLN